MEVSVEPCEDGNYFCNARFGAHLENSLYEANVDTTLFVEDIYKSLSFQLNPNIMHISIVSYVVAVLVTFRQCLYGHGVFS